MSKKGKKNAKERLTKDLRKIAKLIERSDTAMKILHANISAGQQAKANSRT